MAHAFGVGRVAVDHVEALRFDVSLELSDLTNQIISLNQAKVENGGGGGRNDVSGKLADIAAVEAVNVQRRLIYPLKQALAAAFRKRDRELLFHLLVDLRCVFDRLQFGASQRLDVICPSF